MLLKQGNKEFLLISEPGPKRARGNAAKILLFGK